MFSTQFLEVILDFDKFWLHVFTINCDKKLVVVPNVLMVI